MHLFAKVVTPAIENPTSGNGADCELYFFYFSGNRFTKDNFVATNDAEKDIKVRVYHSETNETLNGQTSTVSSSKKE